VICCDQLSRNIFRGQTEAFQYDKPSVESARLLASSILKNDDECAVDLPGEVYPPYIQFVSLAFTHSEELRDHEIAIQLIEYSKKTYADNESLVKQFTFLETFALDHMRVIERFGRYPHRNRAHGRTHTEEEAAWLADRDNLPIWAKSQE
jgi:uncharacterized protein (DUF924 family)